MTNLPGRASRATRNPRTLSSPSALLSSNANEPPLARNCSRAHLCFTLAFPHHQPQTSSHLASQPTQSGGAGGEESPEPSEMSLKAEGRARADERDFGRTVGELARGRAWGGGEGAKSIPFARLPA